MVIVFLSIILYIFLYKLKMQLPPEYLWTEDKSANLDLNNNKNEIINSKNVISRQNLLSLNNENIINNNNLFNNNNNNYLDINFNRINIKLKNNPNKNLNIENNSNCNINNNNNHNYNNYYDYNINNYINNFNNHNHNHNSNYNYSNTIQYKKFSNSEKNNLNKYIYYYKYILNMSTLDIFENQNNFINKSYIILEKKIENHVLLNELNDDSYQQKILAKYRAQNESYLNIDIQNKNNFRSSIGKNFSQIEKRDYYNDSLNDTDPIKTELLINKRTRTINDNSKENINDSYKNISDENNGDNNKMILNENKINLNIRKKPFSKFSSENISCISHESGYNKKEKLAPNWLESIKRKISGKNLMNISQNGDEYNNNNNMIHNNNNRTDFSPPKKKISKGKKKLKKTEKI